MHSSMTIFPTQEDIKDQYFTSPHGNKHFHCTTATHPSDCHPILVIGINEAENRHTFLWSRRQQRRRPESVKPCSAVCGVFNRGYLQTTTLVGTCCCFSSREDEPETPNNPGTHIDRCSAAHPWVFFDRERAQNASEDACLFIRRQAEGPFGKFVVFSPFSPLESAPKHHHQIF